VGEPMKLVVWTQGTEAQPTLCLEIEGEIPEEAKNHPMEAVQVEKQLKKTGNTPFVWNDLQIELSGNLFLPVQALNQLRRQAMEQLEEALQKPYRRSKPLQPTANHREKDLSKAVLHSLHISVETKEQLETILSQAELLQTHSIAPLSAIYLDAESLEEQLEILIDRIHQAGLKAYVALPNIFRMETADRYWKNRAFWSAMKADGYMIRNLEEQDFLDQIHWEKERILDHNVYSWNLRSRNFWREKQISGMTNPLELNRGELKEISDADSIQIIYGRYPMMVTAGCLHKTLNLCRKESGQWILKDRYQKEFPVKNYCRDCYNIIYNSQPLYLLDQMEMVESLGVGICRMMFTTEHADKIRQVLSSWETGAKPQMEFTRGHFKRGVE
jgi:putative protease